MLPVGPSRRMQPAAAAALRCRRAPVRRRQLATAPSSLALPQLRGISGFGPWRAHMSQGGESCWHEHNRTGAVALNRSKATTAGKG